MKRSSKDKSESQQEPWYKDGLQFTCSQCGDCCTGGPGYVWLRDEDIEVLAAKLHMEVDAFERKYVRRVGVGRSLVEYPDGDCVFFDPRQRNCTVYDARPLQCRTWPFWGSNLESPLAWKHTCQKCPGSGQGQFFSLEEIEARAAAMKL
jgi:Fe-S-cluster containining protein